MKCFMYIDNFRGFADTSIPITQVNFLVGENSTGKTSVLGLFRLFSDPQMLLMRHEFGDEHTNFGNFLDMVSAHSSNQEMFHIGIAWQLETSKKGETRGYLLTYKEDKGLPLLSKCVFYRGTEKIALKVAEKSASYRNTRLPEPTSLEDLIEDFRSECRGSETKPNEYQKLKAAPSYPKNLPPLVMLSIAQDQMSKETGDEKPKRNWMWPVYWGELVIAPNLCWVAPIRTKPKRTYDELTLNFSPEGAHTPYLIRRILDTRSQAKNFRNFISKVGRTTGLFQDVNIRKFGSGATAPFEVDIVLDGKGLNLNTVGYGVSQSLPVLVEILARPSGSWFAIQQPEVHLHPRAQAALGDVFFESAALEGKHFIIETHSDFMIDRFRMQFREDRSSKPAAQVLFFERKEKQNVVVPLQIDKNGQLPPEQPDSYRDFFIREQMHLIGI